MICNWEELKSEIDSCREGKKIVFTNGCFDLLHVGHVRYLNEARRLGDYLVVALNSDSSVKRLKGESRPIQKDIDRVEIMDALRCVDYTTIFDQDTPYELIKWIEPDVLAKGGDWSPDAIVGSDIVQARGGEVHSLRFIDGRSTTQIVEKMTTES